MNDPNVEVFVNLKSIHVLMGVARAAAGQGGWMDWELLQIREHLNWWPRIRWWKQDDIPADNPFEI
jgi:hypothetical protein